MQGKKTIKHELLLQMKSEKDRKERLKLINNKKSSQRQMQIGRYEN